jgi:molybdopterin converting factor small subunit
VTGAISLVNAAFARILSEELSDATAIPAALAGWNKVLSMHQHMMLQGYQTAIALDEGDFPVVVSLFARLRTILGRNEFTLHLPYGARANIALQKIFNYFPVLRKEVFEPQWEEGERVDEKGTPWLTVEKTYRVRRGWRLLRNGRNILYEGDVQAEILPGDVLQIFPPGR